MCFSRSSAYGMNRSVRKPRSTATVGQKTRSAACVRGAACLVWAALSLGACRGEHGNAVDAATIAPAPTPVHPAAQAPAEALTPDAKLEALVRANLDAELSLRPTLASWLGDHDYDDKLDDVRTDAQLHEATRLRQLADALRAMSADQVAQLSPNARIDYRLLQRRTEAALNELSELRPLERSPLFYVDIAQDGIESLVTARNLDADTLRSLNGRLWRMRGLFDEARRNLRGTSPELSVHRAIEGAQALRAFLSDALPHLVQAVSDQRAADDARVALGDAGRALDEFVGWLQRDFQPRAHGDLALGAQRWWDRLRLGEDMPGSIEVLVPRVEAALNDANLRVDEATRAVLAAAPAQPPRSAADVPRMIEDDHLKAEELFAKAQLASDQLFAVGRMRGLPVPPQGQPRVIEMPAQLTGFVRVQANAPLEKRPRAPLLYVDPPPLTGRAEHLRLFNRPTMIVTLAHELLGHFLVGLARRQAPTLMQKLSASLLLDEGLAQLVERVPLEEGPFTADAKIRYVVERNTQLRLLRLLGSIRFHAQGLKLDELARFFGEEGDLDEYTARREAERVALDPFTGVEALGRLELDRLRADFVAAHGNAPGSAFYTQLLAHGGTPPELLRELMLSGK